MMMILYIVAGAAVVQLLLRLVGLHPLSWFCGACTSGGRRNVKGKVVVLTGGSQGIGLSMAKEFMRRGAKSVVLMARTKSKLEAAVEELLEERTEASQQAGYVAADVTKFSEVSAAMDEIASLYGGPDMLVACAGASYPDYFLEQDCSVFERTMMLNYMGTVHAIKAAAPKMVEGGGGDILLVASAAAVVSYIGYASYAPTKFALRGLADTIRNELKGFGVRVSIAYPPDTATPGFARERTTKPAENRACFPDDPYDADVVASSTVSSFLQGDYHVQSPDHLQNLLISSMSGVTPRPLLFLEMLLSPIVMLVTDLVWRWFDFQAGKYAENRRRARPAAKAETGKDE